MMAEGCKLELLTLSLLHINHMGGSWFGLFGGFLATALISGFVLLEWKRFKLLREVWTAITGASPADKESPQELLDHPKLGGIKCKFLAIQYTGYRIPTKIIQLYFPMIQSLRGFLLALAVVFSVELYSLQIALVLLIEACYLHTIIEASAKASKVDNWADVFGAVLNLMYVFAVFTAAGVRDCWWQQSVLGLSGSFVLIAVAISNVLFVVYSTAVMVIDICKKKKQNLSMKAMTSDAKTNDSQEQLKLTG